MSSKREIPRFNHPIIETHCHLDYLKQAAVEAIVQQALAVHVEKIITIAVSPDNLRQVAALAQRLPQVFGTQGVHPHEASAFTDQTEADMRAAFAADQSTRKLVAVGEIGLDYYYEHSDRKTQRAVFERQLALAATLDLPVVIHSREADEDTQAILQNFAATLKRRGVIHSFTSGMALAEYALSAGWCLGFNGIATFPKAENVREVIRITPQTQILFETDAPYLTPVPYRGKENAPCYIPFVAEQVAQVKGMALDALLPQVYQNSQRVFFGG